MPIITSSPNAAISTKAYELQFSAVGFTSPALAPGVAEGLRAYLGAGHHGDMGWMEANADKRADPLVLWPEVRSVIMVGHNYGPDFDPMEKLKHRDKGTISAYALNADYHDVMKKRLRELASWVAATYGCEVKIFVDTAPVMEKALAAEAGLGWQGKHTCLVSKEFGSWLFLGAIFTTLPLLPLPPGEGRGEGPSHRGEGDFNAQALTLTLSRREREFGHCGSCTRCLDICPTQAFTASGKLDARKCIAYLTIEHKGEVPLEFRKAIGNRIYGCDDCLAVCPWNKFAQVSQELAYHPRKELESPPLRDLLKLDDAAFRRLFSKSPVKRVGRDRFVRNVLIAAGNSEDPSLASDIAPLLDDSSELVAEMARWALGQISGDR